MSVSVSYFCEDQFQPVSVERMFNFVYDCRDTNSCLKIAAVVCCGVLLFLFVTKQGRCVQCFIILSQLIVGVASIFACAFFDCFQTDAWQPLLTLITAGSEAVKRTARAANPPRKNSSQWQRSSFSMKSMWPPTARNSRWDVLLILLPTIFTMFRAKSILLILNWTDLNRALQSVISSSLRRICNLCFLFSEIVFAMIGRLPREKSIGRIILYSFFLTNQLINREMTLQNSSWPNRPWSWTMLLPYLR